MKSNDIRCVLGFSWGLISGILWNFGYAVSYYCSCKFFWGSKNKEERHVGPNSILKSSITQLMSMDLGVEEELLFPEIAKRKAEGPMSKL